MTHRDDEFAARMNRVKAQSKRLAPMPDLAKVKERDVDDHMVATAILLPQFALVLGAVAMIVGRSISMNVLAVEPSTDILSVAEGGIVMILLVVIGLVFGRSQWLSHAALVIGAALAFLGESFYFPLMPDLMSSVYNPNYVALVILNG